MSKQDNRVVIIDRTRPEDVSQTFEFHLLERLIPDTADIPLWVNANGEVDNQRVIASGGRLADVDKMVKILGDSERLELLALAVYDIPGVISVRFLDFTMTVELGLAFCADDFEEATRRALCRFLGVDEIEIEVSANKTEECFADEIKEIVSRAPRGTSSFLRMTVSGVTYEGYHALPVEYDGDLSVFKFKDGHGAEVRVRPDSFIRVDFPTYHPINKGGFV